MVEIAPSILSANFVRLGAEVEAAERGGATIVHVDIMDGHFVPNITMGLPVVESLARHTSLLLDVHLMIANPGQYAERFVEAGAKMVSVHIEADAHLHRTLTAIKSRDAQAGIAINPATPLSCLEEALPFADYIVVMTVNPGFGGQKFIEASTDKVRRLRRLIDQHGAQARIEVDGGIDRRNVAEVVAAGAEIIVAGSAVFGDSDPEQAVRELRNAATQQQRI